MEQLSQFVANPTYEVVCCNCITTRAPLLDGYIKTFSVSDVGGQRVGKCFLSSSSSQSHRIEYVPHERIKIYLLLIY